MHDANLLATTLKTLTSQIAFIATQLTLKLLWSDEIKVILGSTMFYPLLTMTAIFLAVKVTPVRIINKCACYCNRRLKAIWMKAQAILKKLQAHRTLMAIRRSHMLSSMKIIVGAAEILMF